MKTCSLDYNQSLFIYLLWYSLKLYQTLLVYFFIFNLLVIKRRGCRLPMQRCSAIKSVRAIGNKRISVSYN